MKKLLLQSFVVSAFLLLAGFEVNAQGVYNICSVSSTSDTSGTLYDTGGPTGGYQVNEDCTLLVSPSCAVSITLTFQLLDVENGFDHLDVYDGQTVNDPQVLSATGQGTLPAPVTCTSGYMLIVWHSDVSITYTGFECSWTSIIAPSVAPTASFTISDPTPPLAVDVQFTDQSAGGPTGWYWQFGDGDTALRQNPLHAYAAPGTYTVTLIAFTCNESDTITQTLTVQAAPQISVTPDTLTANAQCGDLVTFNLDVSNLGGGQLVYTTSGAANQLVRVLAMSYGSDLFSEFPNTTNAIGQYFTNYTLTTTATTDPGVLNSLLVGKNVLLIPEQELGNPAVWNALGNVIRQFLTNGGSVIWCGSYSSESDCMFTTNVWSGNFDSDVVFGTVDVVNPAHPLAAGLPTNFTAPSATYTCNLTNADKEVIASSSGKDVISTRVFGSGKAIFLAFDYYTVVNENARAIGNAISWGGINNLASWVNLSQDHDTVDAGNTSSITVTFQTTGLPAGTYYTNIGISNNDPNSPIVIVPCTLTVSGLPIVALSDTCEDFGSIMQHTTQSRTFQVLNNGCDTLFISSISSNAAEFTITGTAPSYILPGGFSDITVNFSSATVGTFSGTLSILNNDQDTSICLSGSTFAAPEITTAAGVTVSLPACGQNTSATFSISNTGGSDLTYSLGSAPAWATINPAGGDTLAPADSSTITLNFASDTLAGGPYTFNLVISSNDPLSPVTQVPVTMNVDFNPCISYTFTTNTCTGQADFTSSSINTPTTYNWDFGDSTTDQTPNPTHYFSANGTYTVTLIACNASGCDTAVQSVQAIITGPPPANCYPVTTAYCCGIGLTNVHVANINNTSGDAVDGYSDYTCTDTTTLLTNSYYNFTATTGFVYVETVKAWIDWNNDHMFDPATEQIFADSAILTNHSGSFFVPPTAVLGEPLRFRVASDYSGNPTPTPCLDLQYGQVEDYSVIVDFYDGISDVSGAGVPFSVYPNPYTSGTSINYNLKNASQVSVEVFNIIGEKVQSFCLNQQQDAGRHSYVFEGKSEGVYMVKLSVNGKTSIQKIVKM